MIYRERNAISENISIYIIAYLIERKIQKTNTNFNASFFFSFIPDVIYARIEKDIHFKYKYQDKG